jgi:hypothetical protein
MKRILFVVVFLLCSSAARAQATQTLAWSYVGVPVATVNTYQTNLKINTGPNNAIAPTCVAAGANTNCSFPVPSPIVLKTGDSITVTASLNGQSAATTLLVGPGPATPTTITITITIN